MRPRRSATVARVRTSGPRPPGPRLVGPGALDAVVWVLFVALFVGAALLVKVAAVLLVVLVVLAVLFGLALRILRKRRSRGRS